jgi:hypothetical protein
MRKETAQAIREVFRIADDEPIVYVDDKTKNCMRWVRLWDKLIGGSNVRENSRDLG